MAELGLVADGDDDVAVGDRERLVGDDVGVRVAEAARGAAGDEVVHRLVGQHPDLGVEERHVDVLAGAGALAGDDRRLDGDHGVEPGEDVGEGDAALLRLAVRRAGQVHDAAHALDDEVVAGAVGVGAVLAEAADRAVDQPRILGAQGLVVEAEATESADLEVLDQHVGTAGERADDGASLLGAEVDGDRALAAIGGVEIGGIGAAVGVLDEGRPPCPRVVAGGRFDLDHLGAEIGEHLPRPRPGQHTGELEHADAGERGHARRSGVDLGGAVRPSRPACGGHLRMAAWMFLGAAWMFPGEVNAHRHAEVLREAEPRSTQGISARCGSRLTRRPGCRSGRGRG